MRGTVRLSQPRVMRSTDRSAAGGCASPCRRVSACWGGATDLQGATKRRGPLRAEHCCAKCTAPLPAREIEGSAQQPPLDHTAIQATPACCVAMQLDDAWGHVLPAQPHNSPCPHSCQVPCHCSTSRRRTCRLAAGHLTAPPHTLRAAGREGRTCGATLADPTH